MKITTLSSKPTLKFQKSSGCLYKASNGFSLVLCNRNQYILRLNDTPVKWSNHFYSIAAAERFLNNHDYLKASVESIPYSADDISFIIENYNFTPKEDLWTTRIDDYLLILKLDLDSNEFTLTSQRKGYSNVKTFSSLDDLILELDDYFGEEDIFSFIAITDKQQRITAASTRDLARNLVRVKSSNIWSYGITIKDNKAKYGDVMVQFKGERGGPGDVYIYYDVPVNLWRKWLSAPSKGHFFWVEIRNNFLYRKLTGDKRGKLKNAIN